jgi:hypothetical protein
VRNTSNLLKYFEHGILWSITFTFIVIAWIFILVGLLFTGLLLGIIIGLALLFILMGAVNSAITNAIWKVNIESDWKSDFIQGLGLFIALTLAHLPDSLIINLVPDPIISILLFIPYCFIDGAIAKALATSGKTEKTMQARK